MKRLFVLLFALSPTVAIAQSHCKGQTQIDANFCAKEKWTTADRELNRLWKQIKPMADAHGTGRALLADERAWIRKRDATCNPELHSGGSGAAMFYWSCMEQQTLRRNQVLRAYR